MMKLHMLWSGVHHQAPPHGVDALKGDHTVVDATHQRLLVLEVTFILGDSTGVLSEVRVVLEVAPLCGTTTTVSSSRTPGPCSTVTGLSLIHI